MLTSARGRLLRPNNGLGYKFTLAGKSDRLIKSAVSEVADFELQLRVNRVFLRGKSKRVDLD